MFGLTFEKLALVAILAAFLIGPTRLPAYAAKLATIVKSFRGFLDAAQNRAKEELGTDIDWRNLDPRQYDPRSIIREALAIDENPARTPVPDAPSATPPEPNGLAPTTPSPKESS